MSQPGGYIDNLDPGTSWSLIAHSAIKVEDGPGAGGILAASRDIADMIGAGNIGDLFIFPTDSDAPGLYLWSGTVDADGAQLGAAELLHPSAMQLWLDRNGEAP